jgi:hypothetical protein
VNWFAKYSFLTAACTALSVSPLAAIGSSNSQRWMKPSEFGAFSGEAGLVRVGPRSPDAAATAISATPANAKIIAIRVTFTAS